MVKYIDEDVPEGTLAVPVTGRLKIGSDDDLVRLNEAAWQVLERTGFKIYSKRILEKVEALGATVDHDDMTARFPRKLIEETVDCELRPEPENAPVAVPQEFGVAYGEVCFFLYDWEKDERRAAELFRRACDGGRFDPVPALRCYCDHPHGGARLWRSHHFA